MVGKSGEGRYDGRFLTTSRSARGDEHTSKLARQGTLDPEPAGRVPKRLENARL